MNAASGFPQAIFDAPVLRGLDARARREIEGAGRLVALAAGDALYEAGAEGASFFVVASGKVALHAVRRGDDRPTLLRTAASGESFGEEATVGMARRATATAEGSAVVAEIPVALFRRAAGRAGAAKVAERLERALLHRATRDLFGTLAFTRDLPARDIDVLLDAASHQRVERGEAIYRQGDRADALFLIADGMVQIQTEEGDRLHVRAYLTRGDFFGEGELLAGSVRAASAMASGPSHLVAIPGEVFRALAAAHPARFQGMRRLAEGQQEEQRGIVAPAAQGATAHAFRDLYRLEVARSLLMIDLSTCVRCGHCAWACAEVHGTSRLVRRGDKMVARLDEGPGGALLAGAPQHLLLPNSCQHCENPACMAPCPTGAIGREPGGEVFIREELCTGCGACAKACPWDNIQMAARPKEEKRPGPPGAAEDYAQIAVKCDLCRAYEGPACVQACPTEAIFRVNPAEALIDVRALLRGPSREAAPRAPEAPGAPGPRWVLGAALAAAGLGFVGAVMQARERWAPGGGPGLSAGVAAALAMLLLLGYAIPKRAVRRWMKPRAPESAGGKGARGREGRKVVSVVRPQLAAHIALGLVTVGLALAHAPLAKVGRPSPGGALAAMLLATSLAGGATALAYRLAPRRLARIERTAALPEDFASARQELVDRLYREVSGKSELVKKIVERVLLPYARHAAGPLALLASGRSLSEEEQALRARIDAALEGRGKERLAGLSGLVRIVVELRALSAQRALLGLLRAGLPVHVVTFGVAMALLVLHVAVILLR